MRLLNTTTFKLTSFRPDSIPPYAILSHTWGEDEITFRDLSSPRIMASRKAYPKLRGACEHARVHGYQYIWIDTCCIDKSSSAELSESIVSMFKWYQKAEICFVYLQDFRGAFNNANLYDKLKTCRWFTRGWTVQELIAPRNVTFVNANWQDIGTKDVMRGLLGKITGISADILTGGKPLDSVSVKERINWVVKSRKTTREEDLAYCLIGILNVSMQVIYGEGRDNAFDRLLSEIDKQAHYAAAVKSYLG